MKIKTLTQAAVIAALYVALTFVSNLFGLASGVIQLRLSEALTILPAFTSAAVPGLFIGCILSNLLTGCLPFDVLFGSLATLLGALGTLWLKKRSKWLLPLPPILANTLIVPFILSYVYGATDALSFLFVTVFIGEFLSCFVLGISLHALLSKQKHLFK